MTDHSSAGPGPTDEPNPAAVGFVLHLVRALHRYGESAQRVEDIVVAMGHRLGLHDVQVFSTPTSIMASFGPLARQRTHMIRVTPGEVNLGKLADVEEVSIQVAEGRCTPDDGAREIGRIESAPPPYSNALTILAFGLSSGAACELLGGGVREIPVAALLGLGLGFFMQFAAGIPRLGGVSEPLAAFFVSFVAVALAHALGPLSVITATLAGLVILLPGLTLTTALNELVTRHLSSGTARLSGAIVSLLAVAFGVAVGNRVGAALFGVAPVAAPELLGPAAHWVAIVVASLSFVVIFRASWRDAPFVVAAGALGVIGSRIGAAQLGPELGAFVGSLAIAIASTLYERWRRRPGAIVLVPGLILLVPGTVGFRSVNALLERQAVAGIETAFSAALTAIALVAGLLVANVLAPEARLVRGSRS